MQTKPVRSTRKQKGGKHRIKWLFAFTWMLLFALPHAGSQGFLHAEGKRIVDANGENFILRGMGLGGWMLQEGYMLKTAGFASAQYQIRQKIESLIGRADTDLFYDAWLSNHVRKADIDHPEPKRAA